MEMTTNNELTEEALQREVDDICDMGGGAEWIRSILSSQYTIAQEDEMEQAIEDICDMGGATDWIRSYLEEHPELWKGEGKATQPPPAPSEEPPTQAQLDTLRFKCKVREDIIAKLTKHTAWKLLADYRAQGIFF